ncbi:hypothetical protein QIS74_13063 [Colletotrichum tabaci]|uniref:NmrA-like domain-containing protein n=1 Tax=Colletotrichum tabaci TaxID=1209068 RepID=A0AAV9SYA4_9PEZI
MVVIAVAGGTGDVGRVIVEELLLAGRHKVLILGRKLTAQLSPRTAAPGPKVVAIDYDDVEGTAKILQCNKVHTVIAAMSLVGTGETSQQSLILAADKSSTTHRFLPSEFGYYITGSDPKGADEMSGPVLRARETLSKTELKTTRFANGIFMDYFGQPGIPSTLRPFRWAVDVPSRRAAIPGTGEEALTVTYSRDVGRFVARLMDDEEWCEYSNVSGSDTCLNEIVAIAEGLTGDKFKVTYDSAEDIRDGKASVVTQNDASYGGADAMQIAVMMGRALINGELGIPKDGRLNAKYPELKPMSIEEMMIAACGGRPQPHVPDSPSRMGPITAIEE